MPVRCALRNRSRAQAFSRRLLLFLRSDITERIRQPAVHFGIAVAGMRAAHADRLRSLAGESKLPPGLATHRNKGRDLSPLGEADPRKDRLKWLAGIGRRCCLVHFRSPLVELVSE